MASKVFNIIIKLTKEGGADKKTVQGLIDVKNAMVTAGAIAGSFAAAYYAADKVLKATVGTLVELGTQVEAFSHQTGMSAEDSSRLLEVMGDLEISAEEVGTAFKFAEKNGFSPNIQSVLKLREQYLQLNPGMERTQFLLKEFGKSGISLQKFFETGDAADRINEVNAALILTGQTLEDIQKYKDSTDEINDAWKAFTITLGQRFLPILNKVFDNTLAGKNIMGSMILGIDKGTVATNTFAAALEKVDKGERDNIDTLTSYEAEFMRWGAIGTYWTKRLADENKILADQLSDQTAWEQMYTGAQDATSQVDASFSLMGDLLKNQMGDLQVEGEQVWQGLLAGTGRISPAAIEQFVLVQDAFNTAKKMLEQGIAVDVVVSFLTNQMGAANQAGAASQAGGGSGWQLMGTQQGVGTGSAWYNAELGQWHYGPTDTGWAQGGLVGGMMGKVGEQGEEWLVRNGAGGTVVIPNDMVRRLKAWGINPGELGGYSMGGGMGLASNPVEPVIQAVTQPVTQLSMTSRPPTGGAVRMVAPDQDELLRAVKSLQRSTEAIPERLAAQLEKRIK
jgi:hypothetical protein